MKGNNGLFVGIMIISAFCLSSCVKSSIKNTGVNNEMDSVAYALGVINAGSLKADSLYIDPIIYAKAMYDVFNNKSLMNDLKARSYVNNFIVLREAQYSIEQEKLYRQKYAEHAEENERFLEQNKERAGVTVTNSGLQYEVLTMGTGPKPVASSVVSINYTGTRIDGSIFDSSYQRGEPATFEVGSVIPGFAEALQMMPVGSKFTIYVPTDLAYGSQGSGSLVEPYSTVIFEVELLNIEQ